MGGGDVRKKSERSREKREERGNPRGTKKRRENAERAYEGVRAWRGRERERKREHEERMGYAYCAVGFGCGLLRPGFERLLCPSGSRTTTVPVPWLDSDEREVRGSFLLLNFSFFHFLLQLSKRGLAYFNSRLWPDPPNNHRAVRGTRLTPQARRTRGCGAQGRALLHLAHRASASNRL